MTTKKTWLEMIIEFKVFIIVLILAIILLIVSSYIVKGSVVKIEEECKEAGGEFEEGFGCYQTQSDGTIKQYWTKKINGEFKLIEK